VNKTNENKLSQTYIKINQMYKLILIFATLLFSTGAFAKGCNNVSLQGTFSYEVSGVNSFPLPPPNGPLVTQSTHVIGKVNFDGKGNVTFKGFGSAAGQTAERTGTGSYEVNADCNATGTMNWSTGETSDYWIELDQMDDSQQFNRAYHANVMVTDNNLHSASGSMTRRIGKFK
jgi:hypothetical protein